MAEDEPEPIKYWLSTVPEDIGFERLVDLTKLRWRIERDYQELKQEFGFGQYEGRGYGFLIAEGATHSPLGRKPKLRTQGAFRSKSSSIRTRHQCAPSATPNGPFRPCTDGSSRRGQDASGDAPVACTLLDAVKAYMTQ